MATPIDNKELLQQFLEGSSINKELKEEFPKVEGQNQSDKNTSEEKTKKNLRFSITVPTPLALEIREYVTRATIQRLVKGSNYSISQFFSEAAKHYIQKESD